MIYNEFKDVVDLALKSKVWGILLENTKSQPTFLEVMDTGQFNNGRTINIIGQRTIRQWKRS